MSTLRVTGAPSCALGFFTLVGSILASVGVCQSTAQVQPEPTTAPVVFVCEHGNVKSLIAASLFEQVAKKRGLSFRAVSRGLSPQPNVPARIADALRSDGIEIEGFKPQALTPLDVATASRVIAIGVDLSAFLREEQVSTELWHDVPPASVDYAASRTVLLRHIDVLLDELQRER
jgi:arsenate reductase